MLKDRNIGTPDSKVGTLKIGIAKSKKFRSFLRTSEHFLAASGSSEGSLKRGKILINVQSINQFVSNSSCFRTRTQNSSYNETIIHISLTEKEMKDDIQVALMEHILYKYFLSLH